MPIDMRINGPRRIAVSEAVARQLVNQALKGGSNGAAIAGFHGFGGGSPRILAGGTVTIAAGGSIAADGTDGADGALANNPGGGGAGGIVVIASSTSITSSGVISGGSVGLTFMTTVARPATVIRYYNKTGGPRPPVVERRARSLVGALQILLCRRLRARHFGLRVEIGLELVNCLRE